MILGMTTSTFTLLHVVLSLIGIAAGMVVLFGLIAGKRMERLTVLFLATTVATSATGFAFPFQELLPSHKVGIVSLIVLTVAILARYSLGLKGGWRRTYVICASLALYLNVFVGVVQAFQKIPSLKALAPTQSEPPFAVVQLLTLGIFCALTVFAARGFHEAAVPMPRVKAKTAHAH